VSKKEKKPVEKALAKRTDSWGSHARKKGLGMKVPGRRDSKFQREGKRQEGRTMLGEPWRLLEKWSTPSPLPMGKGENFSPCPLRRKDERLYVTNEARNTHPKSTLRRRAGAETRLFSACRRRQNGVRIAPQKEDSPRISPNEKKRGKKRKRTTQFGSHATVHPVGE